LYFTSYFRLFKYMVSFPRYFTVCITYQPPLVYYNVSLFKITKNIRVYFAVKIQKFHSCSSCLKYVSKENQDTHFNCRKGKLSFTYWGNAWVNRTQSFKFPDTFVLKY